MNNKDVEAADRGDGERRRAFKNLKSCQIGRASCRERV